MQSDFEPKAIKAANVKLEKQLLNITEKSEERTEIIEELTQPSLWKRILTLFK